MHSNAEDLRRRQLVAATLDTIAEVGFGATTLALIGRRAGVSAGLIAHYFGDKDGLLEATLRSLAGRLSRATTDRLRAAEGPRERVQAVIEATLAPEEFDRRSCSVWLAFWSQVNHSDRLRRIQAVYQRRMLSNLRHALRPMVPEAEARRLATALAAMIDGLWLRATLSSPNETDSATARAIASAFVDDAIARAIAASDSGRTATNCAGPVERAIAAARAAQPRWAARTGRERGDVLRAAGMRLCAGGNRPASATGDDEAAGCLAALADLAGLLGGRVRHGPEDCRWQEPLGIVAVRGGASAPAVPLCRAAAAALAFGNAVIAVPDAAAADAAARLAAALAEAGLPAGLFSVPGTRADMWEALRRRPEVSVAVSGPDRAYRTTAV